MCAYKGAAGKCRFRTLYRESEWCCCLSLCLQASRKVGWKKWNLFIKMYPYTHMLHTYTCSVHAFKLLQMSVSEDWLYFLLFHLPCLFLLSASSPPSSCIFYLSVSPRAAVCCLSLDGPQLEKHPLGRAGGGCWDAAWLSLYDLLPLLNQAQGLVFFPHLPPNTITLNLSSCLSLSGGPWAP